MSDKKGQNALEFIMTYGWAIMAFLVSIAALVYFDVIPGDITGASVCALSPGINCLEYKVTALGVTLVLQNSFPYTLTNVAANITNTDQGPCFESAEKVLPEGRSDAFFVRCDNIKKNRFKGDLLVRYRKEGGVQRSFTGAFSSPVKLSKNASDVTPPIVVLERPDNGFNYTTLTFNLVYNVSDASPVICWYILDSGPQVNLPDCEDTLVNSVASGTHTIKVYSMDENGNAAFDQATFYTNDFAQGDDQLVGAPGCIDSDLDLYFYINASACPVGTDCNDNNANVNPGAGENTAQTCSDGLDNNCNGKVDANDISGVPPGEPACYYNFGASQSGGCDYDRDTYGTNDTSVSCFSAGTGDDCNDFNASINHGATEVCNGVDDNCNGQVDEGVACSSTPSLLSYLVLGANPLSSPPYGIFFENNNVYLAFSNTSSNYIYKIDVSNKNSLTVSLSRLLSSIGSFVIDSSYVYYDTSNTLSFLDKNTFNSVGTTYLTIRGRYAILNNYIYASDFNNKRNVTIIDTSNKNSLLRLGNYTVYPENRDLTYDKEIVGNVFYVNEKPGVGNVGYLGALDVSDKSNIVSLGLDDMPGIPEELYILGNYAYNSLTNGGVYIADISNPANIQQAGFYDTPGISYGVFATSDNFMYVADGASGLLVFDVSNKASPRPVGQYCAPGAGSVRRVVVDSRTAYITELNNTAYNFRALDLSFLNNATLGTISIVSC